MKDIWDIVTDFNKLTLIAPNNNCFPSINTKNMKQEEKVTFTGFYNGKPFENEIILKFKDERPGWNKWIISLLISNAIPKIYPNQLITLELTKITEEKCQLIFFLNFMIQLILKDLKKFLKERNMSFIRLKIILIIFILKIILIKFIKSTL